jgi:cell division protein FtsL
MKIILIILLITTLIAAVSVVIEVHKIETDYIELTKNKDDDTEK